MATCSLCEDTIAGAQLGDSQCCHPITGNARTRILMAGLSVSTATYQFLLHITVFMFTCKQLQHLSAPPLICTGCRPRLITLIQRNVILNGTLAMRVSPYNYHIPKACIGSLNMNSYVPNQREAEPGFWREADPGFWREAEPEFRRDSVGQGR